MGLTRSGFVPETYQDIKERIEGKLEVFNPGFDFSPESPDGQLIGVMTYELAQAWSQLDAVYNSYNPQQATGAALRNIGLITGLPYGAANRSYATLEVQGVEGTVIPAQSIVLDGDGNEFYTAFATIIPSNLQVIATVAGRIPVPAGTINEIQTPISGWTGITQNTDGVMGSRAQTEGQFRNTRQRTVMRNYTSTVDAMQAKLIELGVEQAQVLNNSDPDDSLPDGTPPNTIHVTVGELGDVKRKDIAKTILDTISMGCSTFGNTSEVVTDSQGVAHEIFFSIATPVDVEITLDVTYLSNDVGAATSKIKEALFEHVNGLLAGEDVIWSRLFGYITPYAKAQVNTLTIRDKAGAPSSASNIEISDSQFATMLEADIIMTVDGVPV